MAKQQQVYVIPPRLKLPSKVRLVTLAEVETARLPQVHVGRSARPFWWRVRLALVEAGYLILATCLGYRAYTWFAPWPIYRIVCWVIIGILWSNFATTAARRTSTKQQTLEIVDAVKNATMKTLSVQ
ncbi:MAG TPA: hypothetical protein VH593_00020, partial [Ktedonobacteraceae bacterium]